MAYRKPRLIVTDDAPATEARMACAKTHQDRKDLLREWLGSGKVRAAEDASDARYVRITCGDQHWRDLRSEFPTALLVAQITLALHAGLRCEPERGVIRDSLGNQLAHRWGQHVRSRFYQESLLGDLLTVAVKPPRAKKGRW